MGNPREDVELPWQAILVPILPIVIYIFNDQLLKHAGYSSIILRDIADATVNRHEASARLQYLASLILFVGVSIAVIMALFVSLRSLTSESRKRALSIAAGYLIFAAVALLPFDWNPLHTPGIASDIGLPDRCPDITVRCTTHYAHLISLLGFWKWLLVAATTSVIFGTICCMAVARPKATEKERADLLRRQAKRLDLFLVLSAALMVCALLVQLAFLRWPRFAVHDPAFDAHIGAILLYYGVGYTVFLASYYLPVAGWIAEQARHLERKELADEVIQDLTIGLTDAAKRVATLVAPAVAGLLTAWVNLLD